MLDALQKMLSAFYAETGTVPTVIELPESAWLKLHEETKSKTTYLVVQEERPGVFGYMNVRGRLPSIELETGYGTVRIERAKAS